MYQVAPELVRVADARFDLGGFVGDRIRANAENWLLMAPDANPAMLQMLRDRDRQPVRDLIEAQAEDGYLGAFPRRYRLTGRTIRPNGEEADAWDAWNHYHCLLGLLLWHEETGDAAALADRPLVDLRHADGRHAKSLGPRHRFSGAGGQSRA